MKRLYIQLYNAVNGEGIILPLNPESTDIPCEKEVKTYSILNFGDVAVRGNLRLKRINLTNFLPEPNSTWALLASMSKFLKYKPYSPIEAMEMFNRWIEKDAIIRVIISDYLNAEFTVEKHVATIKESVPDLYYSIDLVEYRRPDVKREYESNIQKIIEKASDTKVGEKVKEIVNNAANYVTLKTRPILKYIPNNIIAPKGATIYKIAKLYYGKRCPELAKLNNIIDENMSVAGSVIEMISLEKAYIDIY